MFCSMPLLQTIPSGLVVFLLAATGSFAQISIFPYIENFDTVIQPNLPSGWISSQNRTAGTNDFTTTTSTPRSAPNAVLSTNATVAQELVSPVLDFTLYHPDSIRFYSRRSATHLARVVVEASPDNGVTFPIHVGDTLIGTGSTNYVNSTFALPWVLAGNASVRLRWRILPDAGGTTATFRLDDLTITAKATHDLALHTVGFIPEGPVEDDSAIVVIVVKNVGREVAPAFSVELFLDANRDSIPQPDELLGSGLSSAPLAIGDTQQVMIPSGILAPGNHPLIARVSYAPDLNPANDLFHTSLRIGYRRASVVVNEIMYAPTGTEPEWVELFNSREDSVSLKDWLVSDNIVTTRRIITTSDIRIPPAGYVLLTRDSSALVDIHPDVPSRIIQIPNMPTLNNTGDAVVVYDNRNVTMDSVAYLASWGGNSGGKSLERRDPLGSSTLQQNWGTSRSSTPGRRNSLTRKDFDLAVDSVNILPSLPVIGASLEFLVSVTNKGTQPIPEAMLALYRDVNADSLPQASEFLVSTLLPSLGPLDSVRINMPVPPQPAGRHYYLAAIHLEADEDTMNNLRGKSVTIGHPVGAIRVNEIMYAPPAGVPEWVELVNVSPDTVDIQGWRIGNRLSTSRYTMTAGAHRLPPEGFLVVTKDSALLRSAYGLNGENVLQTTALPTFLWNNGGDAVVLLDNRGVLMDSVHYRDTWGGTNGFSLERIDPVGQSDDSLNWASSADSLHATPGRPNSLVLVDHDLKVIRASSAAGLPGEPAVLNVTMQNVGRMPSGLFVVVLYHDRNNDSTASAEERVAQASVAHSLSFRETTLVTVVWENPPAGGHHCIVAVEYSPDERPHNNKVSKTVNVSFPPLTVVVNEIMYAPVAGQAEYVELINLSDREVDLADWRISDHPTSSGSVVQIQLGKQRRLLAPGGFFTIASDSTILTLYPHLRNLPPEKLHIASRSSGLGLNNDGDAVILRDLTGAVVDSVYYLPSWHNPGVADRTGRSLERINPRLLSNDARNWTTCTQISGGTPGALNSVFTQLLPPSSALSFTPNPFSPDGDGREDVTVIQYSIPLQVSMIRIRIYDVRGRLIRHLVNNEPGGPTGQVVWDGLDDDKQKARIGMYVVLLEAIDEQGGVVETAKGVVVLAARL